jgi:hypothetical protein
MAGATVRRLVSSGFCQGISVHDHKRSAAPRQRVAVHQPFQRLVRVDQRHAKCIRKVLLRKGEKDRAVPNQSNLFGP